MAVKNVLALLLVSKLIRSGGTPLPLVLALTVDLMRFELGDQVPVHLHQGLLGLLVLIQHQLGSDGTGHLGGFLNLNYLRGEPKQRVSCYQLYLTKK